MSLLIIAYSQGRSRSAVSMWIEKPSEISKKCVTIRVSEMKELPWALESRGPDTRKWRTSEVNMGIVTGMKMCTQAQTQTQDKEVVHLLWFPTWSLKIPLSNFLKDNFYLMAPLIRTSQRMQSSFGLYLKSLHILKLHSFGSITLPGFLCSLVTLSNLSIFPPLIPFSISLPFLIHNVYL